MIVRWLNTKNVADIAGCKKKEEINAEKMKDKKRDKKEDEDK